MKDLFNIRRPEKISVKYILIHSVLCLLLGIIMGIFIKFLDLHSELAGKIFSRIMVWFVLCTAISVYSKDPLSASVKVLLFCAGMVGAYYFTAEYLDMEWSKSYMYGWSAFACLSPILSYIVWYAKGKGLFAAILKTGIILVSVASEYVIYGLRLYNMIFVFILTLILRC